MTDCRCMIVGIRQAGFEYFRIFWSTLIFALGFTENGPEMSSEQQFSGWKYLINVWGQRRMARLLYAYIKQRSYISKVQTGCHSCHLRKRNYGSCLYRLHKNWTEDCRSALFCFVLLHFVVFYCLWHCKPTTTF